MQTNATTITCEHCKKQLAKSDCRYVSVQKYADGRFKKVSVLVCADRCAGYYETRNNIKTLQYRLRSTQRRAAW